MNGDIFNSPTEEAARLAAEFLELKELFRDAGRRLTRIEIRLKRAYPEAFPRRESRSEQPQASTGEVPSLTPPRARALYEELVLSARKGDMDLVRNQLTSMKPADLDLLRRELGVSLESKQPSRKALVAKILSRLNESIMISQHAHREHLIEAATPPALSQREDSKQPEEGSGKNTSNRAR
jgi:hypothetical protein